jgi:hypothetical protein
VDEEVRTEVMIIDNLFKVQKAQWLKWRDAARAAFNRSMTEGMGFSASVEAAQEINEYCIKHNIRVGLGPLTEEKPKEEAKTEEKPKKAAKKAPAKRRKVSKD